MFSKAQLVRWTATLLIATYAHSAWTSGLFDYYSKALQSDPDFAAARANYDAEVKSRDLAAAAFYPSINLALSGDKTQYQRTDLGTGVGLSKNYDPTSISLRLTQPIFSKERSAYRRENEVRAMRAQWALAQARQELAQRLVQTYFNYLLTLDQIALAQAQAQAMQAQLTQLEALLTSKTTTRTEVADARARYQQALVQIRAAESALQVRKLEFVKLTGELPSASLLPVKGNPLLQLPEPLDPQAWIDAARESNHKVMAQRATVQLAEAGIDRANAGFYPSISVVASHQQSANPNYFSNAERSDSLSVQLNMNLFEGGSTRTLAAQAVAQAERAKNDLSSVQHDAAIAAGQAYWGVVNGIEQIKAMEQAVAAAELALEGTRMGIKANVKTYADELNAVQLVYASRRDLQKERYTYLISRAQLLWAPGMEEDSLAALLQSIGP